MSKKLAESIMVHPEQEMPHRVIKESGAPLCAHTEQLTRYTVKWGWRARGRTALRHVTICMKTFYFENVLHSHSLIGEQAPFLPVRSVRVCPPLAQPWPFILILLSFWRHWDWEGSAVTPRPGGKKGCFQSISSPDLPAPHGPLW